MAYNFRAVNREQGFLLPPDIRDWIPESDLAWFILDAVKQMNLQSFYRNYRRDGRGGASYPPDMMVSLLLYSYCLGERSSRRIERLCERDVGYRVITANSFPDQRTRRQSRRGRSPNARPRRKRPAKRSVVASRKSQTPRPVKPGQT